MAFNYIVPLVYTAETNDTFIAKKLVKVINCNPIINPNELCGLWNFTRCPNDKAYCNPFVPGDLLYFQYVYSARFYKKVIVNLYNAATQEIIDPGLGMVSVQQNQLGATEQTYYNLIVNTALIPEGIQCFYVKVTLYQCNLDADEEFLACVENQVEDEGFPEYVAISQCYDSLCADKIIAYCEPYCKVQCEGTILIEGYYPSFDCNGNYYGLFNGGIMSTYKPSVRVRGEVVLSAYNFQETITNRKRTKSRQLQNFTLQTELLPPYVVERIALCFNSKTLTVDGVEYLHPAKIDKNLEEGNMWIVKETIQRECDEINYTCT